VEGGRGDGGWFVGLDGGGSLFRGAGGDSQWW
jgi:hypothetical protein